jgi:hypothetical protein
MRLKITTIILCASAMLLSLTACSSDKDTTQSVQSTSRSAPAMIPAQIDGNIQSIQAGDPFYVVLNNVQEYDSTKNTIHKSEEKLKLPKGHFVALNHWQSDEDTLDLFVGDDFVLMTETGQMNDISKSGDQNFAGIVKSINSKEMVIQKVLYDTSTSGAMKKTNDIVTIHLTPYTKASFNGDGSKGQISQITEGDAVLFILIGPPSDYIATQITFFHTINDAGWHMN